MTDPPSTKRFAIRFNSEIGAGQVLQAIVVAGGMAWAVLTYASKVDTTQNDVRMLRIDMTTQLASIQLSSDRQFASVRSDIANLPDVRAELTQLEKRADQTDNRTSALSDRIGQVWQLEVQTRSDLDTLIKVSGARKTP